jgi:hypothetical protein
VESAINNFNGGVKGNLPRDEYGLTGEKYGSTELDFKLAEGNICKKKMG